MLTVGSSEVAGLVGHGYAGQSAMTIWAEKAGKADPAWTEAQMELLEIGKAGEPYARKSFEMKTKLKAHYDEQKTVRWNPDYPAFGASLDAWTFINDLRDLCVVELKIINPRDVWMYMMDVLPEKFTIQVQQQMAVVNADQAILCAVCGTEVIVKDVPRHQKMIDALHTKSEELLECVKSDTAPNIDGSEATSSVIKRMYPEVEPEKVVFLPEEFEGAARDRAELKAVADQSAEEAKQIDSRIKFLMKDAEYAVTPDGDCFSWKKTKVSRTFRAMTKAPQPVRKMFREREIELSRLEQQ